MISDYLLVRRKKLRLSHLYMPNAASIYYFTHGLNIRAVVSWACGVWPLMRESFIPDIVSSDGPINDARHSWLHLLGFSGSSRCL